MAGGRVTLCVRLWLVAFTLACWLGILEVARWAV